MTLIRRSAAGLAALAGSGSMAEFMFAEMLHGPGLRPSPSETRSWDRSIPVLARDLVEAGLGDVEVLLEHKLPLSSRRVDAILAGRHPVTGDASYVVVELKQWSGAELYEDDPGLVTIDGYGQQPQLHPLEQVRGYCEYLVDFTAAWRGSSETVRGVAYLHNATEHGVAPLRQLPESSHARLFTGERRADFMDFLRSRLAPGISGAPYADAFLSSRAVPSRQLLAVAAAEIQQRERETSASRFTKAKFRSGRPQVDELIAAARVPVFLLDEHQVVRPGELGTVDDIEAHAQGLGLAVRKVSLDDQFRCGGSDEYLDWVQRLLGLSPGGPRTWPGDPAFGVYVADRPHELEHVLRSRLDAGYGARMTAGFCWPWSEPRSDGSLVPDVVIGDWSRPWNLRSERALGGAPPSSLWATDPAGFGQIGCVYTAQGFEYDWNGVIIGPDLVWRDGGWVAIRSANKDPDFRSRTTVTDLEFERLVRNVYKVLLTRGMIGTVICSGDDETRAMLRSLVPSDLTSS